MRSTGPLFVRSCRDYPGQWETRIATIMEPEFRFLDSCNVIRAIERKEIMRGKGSFLRRNRKVSFILSIITALLVFTGAQAANEILDPGFGTNGIVTTSFGGIADRNNHIVLQTDGKILISGYYQTSTPFVARYNSNGTVDTTFGINGSITPSIDTFADFRVAVQPDAKIVVAGSSNGSLAAIRYNSNGRTLDNTFGTNGMALIPANSGDARYKSNDVLIQPDRKIVVVGTQEIGNFTNFVIVRFNTNGTADSTFVANGIRIMDKFDFPNNRFNNARAVVIQPDRKIVMSGDMLDNEGDGQISLARLNPDGSVDPFASSTNGKGTVTTPLSNFQNSSGALALQADGRIVLAGSILGTNQDLALVRFNNDGSLDTTFGGTGIVTTDLGDNENGSDLLIQRNGKIIVVGKISGSGFADLLLLRYNSDGTLDNTFGVNGKIVKDLGNVPDSGNGIALQPNGLVVVAGSSNGFAFLARYILDVSSHKVLTSTFKSAGGSDGWVLESGEDSGSGGSINKSASTIFVGDDAKDKQYRGFLSFNTASVPDNAIVTSARLDIRRQSFVGTSPFTTHGDLLLEIRSGTFGGGLALRSADFNAAASPGANQERLLPLTSVWYTSQLDGNNLRFINRYGVTQFRLLYALDDNDDLSADHLNFFSGEAVDANRPKLIVSYFVP